MGTRRMKWHRFRALPNATVKVTRDGNHWIVWHTTVYAGGTRVDCWHCGSEAAALRKAHKIALLVDLAKEREVLRDHLVVREGRHR